MKNASGDVVMGIFSAPGIVPVVCNSPGSRVSIRIREELGEEICWEIWMESVNRIFFLSVS
jgi:hypothetical protein